MVARCNILLASLLGGGLTLALGGCAGPSDPVELIPVGLRATFSAEDRNAQPPKPLTVDQLLAKARGEPDRNAKPTAPAEAAAPATPAADPGTLIHFAPGATSPNAEDALRAQLAAGRALKSPTAAAAIHVGPVGGDPLAGLPLVPKRGAAVRALLPDTLAKSAAIDYAPTLEPETARLELR